MKKQIFVDNETKVFLAKAFKCSRQQVWRALSFEVNSDKAQRMRILALKRGGVISEGYIPDCDTQYDNAAATITQSFGSRVKIVVDRNTQEVTIWVDGQLKEDGTYHNLTIPEFMQLQHETEQLATAL